MKFVYVCYCFPGFELDANIERRVQSCVEIRKCLFTPCFAYEGVAKRRASGDEPMDYLHSSALAER